MNSNTKVEWEMKSSVESASRELPTAAWYKMVPKNLSQMNCARDTMSETRFHILNLYSVYLIKCMYVQKLIACAQKKYKTIESF